MVGARRLPTFVLLAVVTIGGCTVGTIGEYNEALGEVGGGDPGFVCSDEVCDGYDNDCDGRVDEDCSCDAGSTQDCYSSDPATAGIGSCKHGIQSCQGGAWGECEGDVTPVGELCDAYDNDCDGFVDEDCPCDEGSTQECYTGNPITAGIGACQRGFQRCQGGAWGLCEDAVTPRPEECNGEDDDCNGTVDVDADPIPATGGEQCTNAVNLGELSDAAGDLVTVNGNAVSARTETWWTFQATDDADSNGDEFHVDVRFMVNPSNGYVMDVYRGGCSGTELIFSDEPSTVDWFTDFDQTSSGCGGTPPCGEGNCRNSPGEGQNQCNDDSSSFYVRIRHSSGQPACDEYTLELSNGVR